MASYDLVVSDFRASYPEFANETSYTDNFIETQFYAAECFRDNQTDSFVDIKKLGLILNLLTAHLCRLNAVINGVSDQTGYLPSSQKTGEVETSITAPKTSNGFDYWLSTTPYGIQLRALLKAINLFGFTTTGRRRAVINSVRQLGGNFDTNPYSY